MALDLDQESLTADLAQDRVLDKRTAARLLSVHPDTLKRSAVPFVRLSKRRIGHRLRELRAYLDNRVECGDE